MADVTVDLAGDWEQILNQVTAPEWDDAADAFARVARADAPVLTRELQSSIKGRVVDGPDGPIVEVTAGADHGGFVEYGTRHMEPQPYLRPALIETVTSRYGPAS